MRAPGNQEACNFDLAAICHEDILRGPDHVSERYFYWQPTAAKSVGIDSPDRSCSTLPQSINHPVDLYLYLYLHLLLIFPPSGSWWLGAVLKLMPSLGFLCQLY